VSPAPEVSIDCAEINALDFHEVESSNVHSVAIAEDRESFFVRFKGGHLYRYEGVPDDASQTAEELYERLVEADRDPTGSVGKTFNQVIRKSGAPSARVKITDPNTE
jgi:hypothetical protein